MTAPFDLSGRTALVTGASQGLGEHFSRVLALHGAAVGLAARQTDKLDAVKRAIEAEGGRAHAIKMDVLAGDGIDAALDATEAALGPLDILVNNAGVAVTRAFLDLTEEEWDRVLDTNLKGAFLVAQRAARRMAGRGRGSIVNVASVLGLEVLGHVAPYAAAKAGLIHLTKAMALELARHGVRVNALAPGYVETDINREFFASEAGQRLVRRTPQRRLGRLADLDGPLLLLASDAGGYMTGGVVVVDGGIALA